MPDAPAATPVLSTTRTSSPDLARCHAVERPWTPAPITRCLTEAGRGGGMRGLSSCVAYRAIALPDVDRESSPGPGGGQPAMSALAPLGAGAGRRPAGTFAPDP